MTRIIVYGRDDYPKSELREPYLVSATRRDELNGEHSLELVTVKSRLDMGARVLCIEDDGTAREYVVYGVDSRHVGGSDVISTHYCTWSLHNDLVGTMVSAMPGVQTPASATTALTSALGGSYKWTVGTVDVSTLAGASMYMMSGWQALGVVVDNWGGEVDAVIAVDATKAQRNITRTVDLRAHIGSETAVRRFDFGSDVESVKRTYEDGPLLCRIVPLGKGELTENGGYGRKITIESVNNNRKYLTYDPMVDAAQMYGMSSGGIAYTEYPTIIVENPECETPADLKAWAQANIASFCTPKVSYEVDVAIAAREGVDAADLSLGDVVQVVDRKFGGDGLRIEARIVAIEVDELTGESLKVTIGDPVADLASSIGNLDGRMSAVETASGSIADNVVEQATSGIWTYRRWSSGIAECWGTYSASIAVNTSAAGYGGYRSSQITASFPSGLFSERPVVTGTASSSQGFWVNNIADTSASGVKFFLSCGSSLSSATRTVDFHALGRWQ